MSAGHTPGPWIKKRGKWLEYDFQIYGKDKTLAVAFSFRPNMSSKDRSRMIRNFRLISAAPDLLDLLNEAVSRAPIGGDEWEKRARAAITKATGVTP